MSSRHAAVGTRNKVIVFNLLAFVQLLMLKTVSLCASVYLCCLDEEDRDTRKSSTTVCGLISPLAHTHSQTVERYLITVTVCVWG